MKQFPDLHGARIRLIQLDWSYTQDMFDYANEPGFYRYLEKHPPKDIQAMKEYLWELDIRCQRQDAHYYMIQLKAGKVIGTFGVHDIDWRKRQGEISYGLAPSQQHKGLFQEALQLVVAHLFTQLDFHRVFATTWVENMASVRALERYGFQREAVLRDHYLSTDGRRVNGVVMGLLRRDVLLQEDAKTVIWSRGHGDQRQ